MRKTVLIAAVLACGAAHAEEPSFLFDTLRLYHYKLSWARLVKDVQPTPDWLMRFDREMEGSAGEMIAITIDGKPYHLSYVCKPEACAEHKFEVLFDANGVNAWGALGGKNESPAFFGKPDDKQQEALANAMRPSPAAAKADGAKADPPKADEAKPDQSKSE